ncbi:MAG: cytidylate kinase-like family protein [Gemmiger sp.]|nr:cytidylate kinase-like family protein [Gemmiger sp.]
MKPFIITISRQFASMGRSVAQQLAGRLGVEFYDRDIVEETAKRMGLPVSSVSDAEETAHNRYFGRAYPLGMGLKSMQDEIFMIQKNIICDLAARESCILVGRCADAILADHTNLLAVYIYAPWEARLKNCVEKLEMDEKTAKKMMAAVDHSRDSYHRAYGNAEDDFTHRHLMLDSSRFGVEGTAALLEAVARQQFGE